MIRWTWTVFGIITFCGIPYTSEVTVCSEYLVSGLYGVKDTALTASSSYNNQHGPKNSRLHFDGHFAQTHISSSWSAHQSNSQQYLQVQFPRETVVDTIMIQGRGNDAKILQWVKTYHLLYSIDGVTWTTVMSQNQTSKLFTGNSDKNTVVKTSLVPGITAVYIRINPWSWRRHVSLRFDVSGCYNVELKTGQSKFQRMPQLPSSNIDVVFESQLQSLSSCGHLCHTRETCLSFTFDVSQKICRGNRSPVTARYVPFSTESTHYYVNLGAFTSLGFQTFPGGSTLYKVNEVTLNQTTAADVCNQQYSSLFKIKTEAEMSSLQNIIAGNTILLKDHNELFVSGMYALTQWEYSNEAEVIDSDVWSPGNPDPSQGHCVMLTQTGLASVKCTQTLFSICEVFLIRNFY